MKAKNDRVSTFLSKLSHVRRFLFPGKEQIIEAFFAGLDVEKIQQKYRIPSFTVKKVLEKHLSKISKAKSRMGPKSQIGRKSHIYTDSIEDMEIEKPASGKENHVKRFFFDREQIIEASQKPDFDIETIMEKYGITRFQVIMTLKKHQSKTLNAAVVVDKSISTKKEKKELGESRDLKNQEVCTRCDKTLGTWRYKEGEEILCKKCYKVLFRQMFSKGT